ncbi:hypothetical protein B9T28_07740 [Acinetobacter silvestris]|uniref:Uncharacterized protein n=1 Tax=Acinetobacter silvestris TaxID=1977882 RepID=A0A1Y3CJK8_9GAMM|nr:hypothetical protein B9T28_07740 [Acinetobacter silvestris]
MKLYQFISGLFAFFIFLSFCYFFSGSGGEFSFFDLNPIEALNNLVFTFSFGFGVPVWVSYILSTLIILGIPILIYWLVCHLLKYLNKQYHS